MKIIISLLFLLCLVESYGQADFRKQFESLMSDVESRLANYRGDSKEIQGTDSLFYSLITLEGTSKNEITISDKKFHFIANVSDLLYEKQGRKIVDEWKSKIASILYEDYRVKQLDVKNRNPGIYG